MRKYTFLLFVTIGCASAPMVTKSIAPQLLPRPTTTPPTKDTPVEFGQYSVVMGSSWTVQPHDLLDVAPQDAMSQTFSHRSRDALMVVSVLPVRVKQTVILEQIYADISAGKGYDASDVDMVEEIVDAYGFTIVQHDQKLAARVIVVNSIDNTIVIQCVCAQTPSGYDHVSELLRSFKVTK